MMQNYFELFSLKVDFAIDLSALEHTYQTQIAQYHPDKFATADDKKKVTAIQNTSLINTAFDTLKSPLFLARITRNSFASFNMEKLDCKRLATAAFSFSIWIVCC
jgi:DnaJ-domain-containing protein 1